VFLIPMENDRVETERRLGFRFPASFVRFLELGHSSHLPAQDMLTENVAARDAADTPGFYLPEFLVAFYRDGMGNQYCFDTRSGGDSSECSIVFWDHELTTEEKLPKLSCTETTFEKWLSRHAQEVPQNTPRSQWSYYGCLVLLAAAVFLAVFGAVALIRIAVGSN